MYDELPLCAYSSRQLLDVLASRCDAMIFAAYGLQDEADVRSKTMCAGAGPRVVCAGLARVLDTYVKDQPLQTAVHWTMPRIVHPTLGDNDGEG